MTKIQVLMSTYNGEKYICEQINSILSQIGVEIDLLVRDDGSEDGTKKILKRYNEIQVIEAQNVGTTNSFFELIGLAGEYDYYAFADQDDVWDNDKLKIAISKLEKYDYPAIYSGNTRLVDCNLNLIKNESLKPVTTFGSAIVKNYVTGCTAVFNRELMIHLKEFTPQYAPFHDWWANLVCLAIGGVSIYDEEPHMSYRQHGNNVVGGNDTFIRKWKSRFYKFINTRYHRDEMAAEIKRNYLAYLSDENLNIINNMINKKFIKKMTTGNKKDDFLFRVCEVFGKV